MAGAMTVAAAFRRALGQSGDPDEMADDLEKWPDPVPGGRIVRGDAAAPAAWRRLGLPSASGVLYGSPPFGPTSLAISPPDYVRAAAVSVLAASGADASGDTIPPFPGYVSLTLGMLRQAAAHLARGTVILEHEPGDDGTDSTVAVVSAVTAELPGVLHSPRIVRCVLPPGDVVADHS